MAADLARFLYTLNMSGAQAEYLPPGDVDRIVQTQGCLVPAHIPTQVSPLTVSSLKSERIKGSLSLHLTFSFKD